MVYRRTWMIVFSGFFEPMFYLLSFGVGLGYFIGSIGGYSVRELHRAGAAGLVGDERRRVRRDERVLEAEVREDLRRDARDAARADRRALGESRMGALPRIAVLGRVHRHAPPPSGSSTRTGGWRRSRLRRSSPSRSRGWASARPRTCGAGRTSSSSSSASCRCSCSVRPSTRSPSIRRRSSGSSASPRCTTPSLLIRSLTLGIVGPRNLVDVGYLLALGIVGIWIARRRVRRAPADIAPI